MRDKVVEKIVESALQDTSIYLLLGDLGVYQARKGINEIPQQIFNYGIREQSMISFATGISLAHGYPFIYSINPFLNERAIEQIKNGPSYNKTPMCIVTAGGTCDYYKLGKTHYCTNDINNLLAHDIKQIYLPFNEEEAVMFTNSTIKNKYFSYIRLSSSSVNDLPTNELNKDYQDIVNIYIGPDSLVYKEGDNTKDNVYISIVNEDVLISLSKIAIKCRKVNLYAAFNAHTLYMNLLSQITKAKSDEKDIIIAMTHVASIQEISLKSKEDILKDSTQKITVRI